MAKQTFTIGQVLTAAQMTSLQQTAMGGGSTTAKTASYTLVAADAGTVVQMNSASSTTITVNTALFSAGDSVQIQNIGAGVCTVTAGTATVSTAGSLALSQYEGGQLYFNTTSAALFFDIVQSSGMTNPLTTTGDTIYSSSGTTPARLGIGSTGQVLTVASGLPSWTTPASGGGMTLINSGGTTLSGTTTTVSSIPSTYKQLQIIVRGAKPVTIDTIIALRLNTDTGTNYFAINTPTTGATGQTFNNTYFVMNSNGLSNDADAQYNSAWVTLPDYSTTTNYKTIQSLDFSKYAYAGVTQNWSASLKYGAYASATVISSISIVITGASGATAGTVFVYGVS